jgi:hypothetical protein
MIEPLDASDVISVKPAPIPFSGVIDTSVIHDLHALFRRRVLLLELLLFGLGIAGVALGGWGTLVALGEDDWSAAVDSLINLAYAGIAFALAFELRKGWARRLTGQEVSGALHTVGLVVDQLDDRATWNEFNSAWVGERAALIFVSERPHPPKSLALDGLPLHAGFFESEEQWMRARQMIRDRIPKIRMVGSD